MIRNDREFQVALDWIAYWKSTRTVGQSWLGNEQAARQIADLRREIDTYRRGAGEPEPAAEAEISRQPV